MASQKQLEGPRITRKGSPYSQVTPPTSTMVAIGSQCTHRSTIPPIKTCSADIYIRIKRRVGRSLKRAYYTGDCFLPEGKLHKLLELKAVFLAPKELQNLCSNNIVLITTDNTTVDAYINMKGLFSKLETFQLSTFNIQLSRLGQTIQTEWSLHPEVFQEYVPGGTSPKWTCCPPGLTNFQSSFTSPRPPVMGNGCTQPVMGGSICLPGSSHLGQSGGEVVGLPVQQDHTNCTRVAQNALVLGSSDHVQSDPIVLPNLPNQPFNQTLHRNLLNLNLHAWLLEPQLSRNMGSLRQWQHELRLLKEDQPDQSMRQSGPLLQCGASVIRWISGHYL